MENASKALLIAGAILIVILLIAVGMLVYSQSRGAIDTGVVQMSSAEIQMFNSQFTNYEGIQNETATRKFLQNVKNSNEIYKDDKSRWICVRMWRCTVNDEGRQSFSTVTSNIQDGHKRIMRTIDAHLNYMTNLKGEKIFNIKFKYGENGLINKVEIIQSGAEDRYNYFQNK